VKPIRKRESEMSDERTKKEAVRHTLSDDDIKSEPVQRRKFLGTALLGTAVVAAAGFVQACSKSDDCDTDVSGFRDNDPFDLTRTTADPCDSDGT
jgi:hypothetical protein